MTTSQDPGDIEAMRALWGAVALTAFQDYWRDAEKPGADLDAIQRRALAYFNSRDGREVISLAGITASPERLAAVAIDLTAKLRTSRDR